MLKITQDLYGSKFKLAVDNLGTALLLMMYPKLDIRYFIRLFCTDGIAVDIGAHTGRHTLLMAANLASNPDAKEKRVIAFEPSYRPYAALKQNSKEFRGDVKIDTIQLALSYYTGVGEMRDYRFFSMFNSFGRPRVGNTRIKILDKFLKWEFCIPVYTLDRYLYQEYPGHAVKFMIIDAENSEMDILMGARQTIRTFMPVIALEGGDIQRIGKDRTCETLRFLKNYGYRFYEYDHEYGVPVEHTIKERYPDWVNILALPQHVNF